MNSRYIVFQNARGFEGRGREGREEEEEGREGRKEGREEGRKDRGKFTKIWLSVATALDVTRTCPHEKETFESLSFSNKLSKID